VLLIILFGRLRLCGVYGLNDDGVRKYHWDELVGLMSWWELMWYIGGDFNVWWIFWISFLSKNSWTSPQTPLVGGNFTWSNNHDLQAWSRIDRFLLSPE
jgi:hypothetical protein